MKLHIKLSLVILSGLVMIIAIAQFVQYTRSVRLISDLSGNNIALLKEREEQAARNIFRSVGRAVSGSLERGEMEKFTKLLEAQQEIEGLQEFSLYDSQGRITHSSDRSFVNNTLPEDLQEQLFREPEQLFRYADGAMEIYEPQPVLRDCVRCHQTWKVGEICGITSMRFSAEALLQAERRAAEKIAETRQTVLTDSLLVLTGIIAVFVIAMAAAVNRFIKRPLSRVISGLQDISNGEGILTTHKELVADVKRKDEIGTLAKTMIKMEERIRAVLQETHGLTHAIQNGQLDVRGDAESFSGGWQELFAGINHLIAMLTGHIDHIPVPTILVDRECSIHYISQAGVDLFGTSREQIAGRACFEIFEQPNYDRERCVCARAIQTGDNAEEAIKVRLEGKDLYLSLIGVPIRDSDDAIIGAMGVVIDQTPIKKTIHSAGDTAEELLSSAQDIAVSSQEISSISNQQAAAVKEIVTTMEDSDLLAKSIATKITEVTGITNTTKTVVNEGFSIIQDSLAKMGEIKASNVETITEIKSLGDKIDSIWEIVNMINNIADQTKIIAFNAELEASSAGDAGKNFQIVASEIRRLADSTVTSTGEIKAKINEIQHSSDILIMASEEGTEKISEGWDFSNNLQKVFEQILTSSETSDSAAAQIALSINQQVSAFEQILLTLKQISEGIDNFVVSTQSTSESSGKLREMANSLYSVIEPFVGVEERIHKDRR